jgi:4-amino-4-deoxy-L-arabinose transferase-like glycosyltransferase
MAIAILISMILMVVTNYRPDWKLKIIVVVGAILIVSLLRAHWYQLNLQVIWEDEALKSYHQDKSGSTPSASRQKRGDPKVE